MFEWLAEKTDVHGVSLFVLSIVLLKIAVVCSAVIASSVVLTHSMVPGLFASPFVAWKIFEVYR